MGLLENFRAARSFRTVNLVLQAVLFLTLFAGLNYLAGSSSWREGPWRCDLTRFRRYTLSPETVAYLGELSRPARIVVTLSEDAAAPDLRGLLREYAYATESNPDGRISVEYLDVDLRRREAEQLNIDQPGLVVLFCGDNRRTLSVGDLYGYEDQKVSAFLGEQVVTSAILDVSSAGKKRIYFLVGHSELRPDDVDPARGLSAARGLLEQRNFKVDVLDLTTARRIPEDASLLIAAEPRSPYSPSEEETLRQYLSVNDGRLVLFLAPGYRHGLDDLLSDWGVTVDDDILRDSGADNVAEDGDFIITAFTAHPVTQGLLHSSYKASLRVGMARTVRPDTARAAGNGLDCATLAASSPTAWGEVDYASRRQAVFNPRADIRPLPGFDPPNRLGIAVASEHVAARGNLPFSVRTGRLVVFGTGDLIDNARIANAGVLDVLLGAVRWTVDRDTQLNIPARPVERFQLSLSARELENLRYCLMFALPGLAAALGLVVYWSRRS